MNTSLAKEPAMNKQTSPQPEEHDEDTCSDGVTMCHECIVADSDTCDLENK